MPNNPVFPQGNLFRISVEGEIFYACGETGQFRLLEGGMFADGKPGTRTVPLSRAVILAPVEPSKIVAVGLNYRSHAEEMKMPLPDEPLIFLKPPTALAAPGEEIVIPSASRQVEFEGELALVVGKKTRNISETGVRDHLLGITLANDLTARDLQKKDGQWARAKGFDGFCPLGPCIAPLPDFSRLEFSTWLNGMPRQIGRPADMIFSIPRLVAHIASVMTLLPGDVILTGTPPGVGPLHPGDVIRVECGAIGVLENRMVI